MHGVWSALPRSMDNSMDSRTVGAIGIAQIPKGTETCRFTTLHKPWPVVTANHFVHVPMNQDVIDLLNRMASQDSRPISKDIIFRYRGSDLEDSPPSDEVENIKPDTKDNRTTLAIESDDSNINLLSMSEEDEANPHVGDTSSHLPPHPVNFWGETSGPED